MLTNTGSRFTTTLEDGDAEGGTTVPLASVKFSKLVVIHRTEK